MGTILNKILSLIVGDTTQVRTAKKQPLVTQKPTERDLLRQESKIGAALFGPIPKGRHREFFCLDESTWIWHEEWKDEKGVERQSTIRYEIHPNGILKVSDGPRYQFIEGDELKNFAEATRLYYQRASVEVYRRDPKTGLRFA